MSKQVHSIDGVFYKTIDKNEYKIFRDGQSFVFGENDQLLKKTTEPKSLRKRYEIINGEKLPANKIVVEEDGKLVVKDKPKKSKNEMTGDPRSPHSTRRSQAAPPILGMPPVV